MDFKKFAKLIWIEQTLFSLPFAYLGVLFAGGATLAQWLLVTVAIAAARTAAMTFNRVIDARIDARNPRTRERLVPRGEVSQRSVWTIAAVCCLVLIGVSYLLNPLCFYLSFAAVFLLFSYSYAKRFTPFSHFYLGLTEAAAPIGGYLAVRGEFSVIPLVLGFVILMWMVGLDTVYALQDLEIDRKEGLCSIPVSIGKPAALVVSALAYALALAGAVYAGLRGQMAWPYWFGVAGMGLIFLYQQRQARVEPLAPVAIGKFLGANAYVSPALFAGTLAAVLLA